MKRLDLQVYTQFKRDVKRAKKRHFDMDLLKEVVEKLRSCEALEAKYHDHALSGDYVGYRECHLQPNWLLVYKVIESRLILVLARTGTHDDVFKGY